MSIIRITVEKITNHHEGGEISLFSRRQLIMGRMCRRTPRSIYRGRTPERTNMVYLQRPIQATIKFCDGDLVPMIFRDWSELGRWMEENKGRFCGIQAAPIYGGTEHDNDGADQRVKR